MNTKKKMCQGSGKIVEESKKPVRSHFWGKKNNNKKSWVEKRIRSTGKACCYCRKINVILRDNGERDQR